MIALVAIGGSSLVAYVYGTVITPFTNRTVAGDFAVYYHAALLIRSGVGPYNLVPAKTFFAGNFTYIYPPFLAWLLQPLTLVPFEEARLIWLGLLQVSILGLIVLSWRVLGARGWISRATIVIVWIMTWPVLFNLQIGNLNPVMALCGAAFALTYVSRTGKAGIGWVALGLGVAAKLYQAPVWLIIASKRWFDERAGLTVAVIAGLVPTVFAVPAYLPRYLAKVLPRLSSISADPNNISPGGVLVHLLDPAAALANKDVPHPGIKSVAVLASLVVLMVAVWAMRWTRDRRLEVALASLPIPLMASVTWDTHLVLQILPVMLVVQLAWGRRHYGVVALEVASALLALWYVWLLVPVVPYLRLAFPLVADELVWDLPGVGIMGMFAGAVWLARLELAASFGPSAIPWAESEALDEAGGTPGEAMLAPLSRVRAKPSG